MMRATISGRKCHTCMRVSKALLTITFALLALSISLLTWNFQEYLAGLVQ